MKGFNLSALSVREGSITLFLIIALAAIGIFSYLSLGRAEDPPFTVKTLTVVAVWPGATAQEMQDLVADPLEKRMQELQWYDRVESYTRPGLVAMMVTLKDTTPPKEVPEQFYQARKKLGDTAHTLPAGVLGPYINDEYSDVDFTVYALEGHGLPERQVARIAESVRQRLLHVAGVKKVDILGERPERIFVEFSYARLANLKVAPQDVFAALAKQNAITPAGSIDTSGPQVFMRLDGALDDLQKIKDTPIVSGGRALRLSDIATVERGYEDPPTFLVRDNGEQALVLNVVMKDGWNGLSLGAALDAEEGKLNASLPAGVKLTKVVNQAAVIHTAIDEFMLKFFVALAIVLGVSLLTLGWRVGIVVAAAVPLTLAIVLAIMLMTGRQLDRITLGALIISLGLLVDDAIIAIETMVVKLEEGFDRVRAATFAWTSTAFPMLTGTLVTAAGFLPVGIAKSTTGEYAGGIFWVVGIALLVSWVVAVVFTPYLGVLLLPDFTKKKSQHALYDTGPYRRLRGLVRWSVRNRITVVVATVMLFLGAGAGMGLVKQQFFPNSARPELIVDVTLRQGASHQATEAAVVQVEKQLAGDHDIRWFTSYVGGGPPRFFLAYNPALPNDAIATIVLTTTDAEARERVRTRLMAFAASEAVPQARIRVSRLELGPPVGFPVQFRVMGEDIGKVRAAADTVLDTLRNVPGTRDAQLAWSERAPSMRLELDQARVRQLGLSPNEISQTLATLVSGTKATQIRDRTKLVDVVLRAAPAERLDLQRLPDLMLTTGNGWVPLGQVARLVPQSEEPILWRRDRQSYLTVQADVQDGLQAPDVTAAAWPAIQALHLPAGVRVEVGGAAEESAKANTALAAVFPIMGAAMLLLLMIQLQNIPRTLLVLATMPLGIIGAVAALLLADAPFGFVALLGVIALGGMIMRNTIILVDQVRQDLEAGRSLGDAIVESTVRRARPVVLTALAAALAFIPLATNVFWGPMALAMIGGLVVATVLTLMFLPALYALAFRVPRGQAARAETVSAPDSRVVALGR